MGCLSTAQQAVCSCLLVASSSILAPSGVTAFVPGAPVLGSTNQQHQQRWRATTARPAGKMTDQLTEDQLTSTTRQGVVQEFSAMASMIAGTGAVLTADKKSAEAVTYPVLMTSSAGGVNSDEDRKNVELTTVRWKDTVTLGTADAPKKTAGLYALDGVLWGTVSEEVRDTPQEIYDYFDYFARLPKLRLSEYTPVSVRVYDDFATQAGTYTFAWQGAGGETKEKRARFSFSFRRDAESPTAWTIVEHHSSAMPTSPAELKHARNDVS